MGQHLGRNAVRDLPADWLVKMSTKEHVQRTMAPPGSSDQREPRRVCLTLDGATVAGTAASGPYGTIDYLYTRL